MLANLDLTSIEDEGARELIGRLLNLIEKQAADQRDVQAKIQRLRDEVNQLKGEQGKPKLKGNTSRPPAEDHSSETERHKTRQRHKSSKKSEHSYRLRASIGSGSRDLAARCKVQRV